MLERISICGLMVSTCLFFQCNRTGNEQLTGYYEGIFMRIDNGARKEGETNLKLRDSTYRSKGQPNRVPAGGSGSWKIDGNTLVFRDKNIWTADFDWHLILNGKYRYEIKGDSLILTGHRPNAKYYTYRLRKQEP